MESTINPKLNGYYLTDIRGTGLYVCAVLLLLVKYLARYPCTTNKSKKITLKFIISEKYMLSLSLLDGEENWAIFWYMT